MAGYGIDKLTGEKIDLSQVEIVDQNEYNIVQDGLCGYKAVPIRHTNPNPTPRTRQPKTPTTPTTTTPSKYQYKWDTNRTDKRVSLNCAPLTKNMNTVEYIDRIKYVLGRGKYTLRKGQTIYGFLNSMLSGSCGLIFPYTPTVSVSHQVNYDRTDILHSNLAISHYKNTPPPNISIDATFTADTRENALHMLSAIWFLRACTKCDFGELANKEENTYAGMPPPILYLNGYNQVMDNIPVIIKSFSYSLPSDRDYVSLGVNLDSDTQAFTDWEVQTKEASNGNIFNTVGNFVGNATGNDAAKYVNGIRYSLNQLEQDATAIEANRYNNYYFNNWLPTELKFHIDLEIQPNLMKYKKLFELDWYKMGLFNLPNYKTDTRVFLPNEGGGTDVTNTQNEQCMLKDYIREVVVTDKVNLSRLGLNSAESASRWVQVNDRKEYSNIRVEDNTVYADTKKTIFVRGNKPETKTSKDNINTSINGWSTKSFSYTFDRGGWTW